ncbi:endonuclease/exonuclease/phosphatase family protein [Sphingobacterium gobiense]|uniref:Endonuclease n=1 Tax=Sphingobacterium gobiense TaxID=1382456 RepID=A0A2S9JVS0_9SPHI|nr:endonuclease/exonuclease/phosphatase family protein [Sphingobacterium gobiense]PRD57382.1 endonuclease [Sphingobacterium gobiense]
MKRFKSSIYGVWCLLLLYTACKQEQPAAEFTVASFNLRMDTPRDSLNAWEYRKEMVKSLLIFHEIDIVGTQEGFIHQLRDINEIRDFEYVGVGRDDGKMEGEHSAIFYNKNKFEMMDKGDFWFSETPDVPGLGWDAVCCNRICSWVKLQDKRNGKVFFVFNSHFDHQGVKAREESAKLLVNKVREIAADLPVIATGDFNSTPETQQIQTIKEQLSDAYEVSETQPYGPVGTTNSFDWHAPAKHRIDYVFLTDDVAVEKYGVLVDALDMRYPSDHMPVVTKLRWK